MKKYWKIIISIVLLISFVICLNFFCYRIKLDINRFAVNYAEIIYYGDGVEQKIEDSNDLDLLVKTLNKLRFKKHRDMSHLFPKRSVRLSFMTNY